MSDASLSETSLLDAQNLHRMGRLPEAARAYHEFLRTNPRHFEALIALGMIYFQTEQYEQAQYLLGEALRIDPYDINALCFRGLAQMKTRRHDAAIASFDKAHRDQTGFRRSPRQSGNRASWRWAVSRTRSRRSTSFLRSNRTTRSPGTIAATHCLRSIASRKPSGATTRPLRSCPICRRRPETVGACSTLCAAAIRALPTAPTRRACC